MKDLLNLGVWIIIICLLAHFIKRYNQEERAEDLKKDYSTLGWTEINKYITDVHAETGKVRFFIDYTPIRNKPKLKTAIKDFLTVNKSIIWNGFPFDIKNISENPDEIWKNNSLHGLTIYCKSPDIDPFPIVNHVNNFNGDNTQYSDYSTTNIVTNIKNETTKLYDNKMIGPEEKRLVDSFMNTVENKTATNQSKNSIIRRLSTYGGAAASLIELIKAIIL